MVPTLALAWKELEQLLATTYNIRSSSRPAFNAKLRHLQRLDIFVTTGTGRGRIVTYNIDDLVSAALALELIQLGISPERAAKFCIDNRESVLGGLVSSLVRLIPEVTDSHASWLLLDPSGLSYLQATAAEPIAFKVVEAASAWGADVEVLLGATGRCAIIDLRRFLQKLVQATAVRQSGNPESVG